MSLEDNLAITTAIAEAVDVPVMADGEDGFGDGDALLNTVQNFIVCGVAGINIEDQNLRNPDASAIIDTDRMLRNIATAIQAKRDMACPDFIINARTDALKAVPDRAKALQLALERGNRYLEAGADLCFITYVKTLDEVKLHSREIKGPLSIAAGLPYTMREFSTNDCRELGIARVSLPSVAIFSAFQALLTTLGSIKERGDFQTLGQESYVLQDMDLLADILIRKQSA